MLSRTDSGISSIIQPVTFNEIVTIKDSLTSFLNFNDTLYVNYLKKQEPVEYLLYTGGTKMEPFKLRNQNQSNQTVLNFLSSTIQLSDRLPVEINEDGWINNVDLVTNGYFSWWQKIATALPYDFRIGN